MVDWGKLFRKMYWNIKLLWQKDRISAFILITVLISWITIMISTTHEHDRINQINDTLKQLNENLEKYQ